MLGGDLADVLREQPPRHDLILWDIEEADITDADSFLGAVRGLPEPPEVIINCAAYTAVDRAETERETAMRVNGDGAGNISRAAREVGARVVYISTDYVFDGKKETPWTEDDSPDPVSWYGRTKLAGERQTLDACPDALIVRTQWLYGPHGKNFVETMLRLAGEKDELRVVDDQRGSPTYTGDLARALRVLIEGGHHGVYHAANSGETTWFGFAREIMARTGKDIPVIPISTDEFPTTVRRPTNSVFDMTKLTNDTGMTMPPWQEGLAAYLSRRNPSAE
jgi:dTDP-4-dehydrorhamnose reductase